MSKRNKHENSFNHETIYEKSFKKNHNNVTILSEPILDRVPNVAEGRDYAYTN